MTGSGIAATRATSVGDDEMVGGANSITPWDALAGGCEASFADVLGELRPLFPASLLDGEGSARLLERAAELPAAAAAFFGFEFRLGDPDPSADVCVPVASGIGAGAALEAPVARHFMQAAGDRASLRPSRAALARCIGKLGRADSTLARWADAALLEYDVAAPGAVDRGTPGIYFRLRREPGSSGHDVHASARSDIARALADASGWTADLAEQREVERAFDALPRGARIAQAGAMPDRPGRAIRLLVRDIDETAAPDFLARLRWPGRIASASAILTDLLEVFSRFALSFDATARGVGPRLGLEVYAGRGANWQETKRSDWQPCVARLVARNWCIASKAQGLLAWPGHQKMYFDNAVFLSHQGINHVKVTVAGDAVEAKGYVGMSFVPLLVGT